jgi:hypothetical protein
MNDELRAVFAARPDNFDELVAVERARILREGRVRWLERGRVVELRLSERGERDRQRQLARRALP